MNLNLVLALSNEYLQDPNCRPELWISGEDITTEEKERFLSIVKDVMSFNKALDTLEI